MHFTCPYINRQELAYFPEHIRSGTAKDMGAAEKNDDLPQRGEIAKFHTEHRKGILRILLMKKEKEKQTCLRSLTASISLRPARLWTSSRWKLPTTLMYLQHIEEKREIRNK